MTKNKKLYKVDGDAFKEEIEHLGITAMHLSRMMGYKDAYISNNLCLNKIPMEVIDFVKRVYEKDLSGCLLEKEANDDPGKQAVITTDFEPVITAIGQATGILSDQIAEIIKQLKLLNEYMAGNSKKYDKALTDAMVNAIIIGLQESKGIIGDSVKLSFNNSGELRNAITQGIRNARK